MSAETWAVYVEVSRSCLLASWQLLLLCAVTTPIVIILLHALWQVIAPRDQALPPLVFHWLPYIGSAPAYANDPIKLLLDCREKYGNVFTFVLFGRRMTVALGQKGNNFVLGARTSDVSAEEAYTHLTTPCFGKGVVYDVPNEVLMEQKRFIKVGLSIENFRKYVEMIEDEVIEFLNTDADFDIYQMDDDKKWGSFHVVRKLAEITVLTASRTLQGAEVRARMDKTFAQRYHDLDGGFTPVNLMFPNLPLESYRKRDKAQQEMSDFYVDIIRDRKAGRSHYDDDMMSSLMQQQYKNGRDLQDREVAHILIALLMAGQHTSSATGSWALLHLAANPELCEKVYEEQVKHFGAGDGKFRTMTHEELKSLPILDSIIRETLRVHTPIHSIMRKVIKDIPVPTTLSAPSKDGAYVVPKGHFLLSSPAVSQVDPRTWKNGATWDPARWSDPEGVAAQAFKTYFDDDGEKVDYGFGAISKGTESPYQPFGAGRHRCIGEQFAYLQLGTIIATIVRRLELRLDTDFPGHNYHTLVTLPKDPCEIRYRRRHMN